MTFPISAASASMSSEFMVYLVVTSSSTTDTSITKPILASGALTTADTTRESMTTGMSHANLDMARRRRALADLQPQPSQISLPENGQARS